MDHLILAKGKERSLVSAQISLAVKDTAPVLLGVIPFGITCGVMGKAAGLTPVEIILMSLLVFAGAAQFVSITMIAAGITDFVLIVFTTFLINLRHLIMSASLAPYMLKLPLSYQAILSFVMTDESYAMTTNRIYKDGYNPHYQLGTSMSLYVVWAISTVIGVIMGSHIKDPLSWGLDFAMPATFLVLLMPRLVDRISVCVCTLAGVIAVLGAMYLPGKWYIIISCLGASVIGAMLERKKSDE